MSPEKNGSGEAPRSFQERLEELTALVEELEGGELSLEQAIERFERGQKLHAGLLKDLEGYERRIEKLVQGPSGEDSLEQTPEGTGGDGGG